MSASAKERYEDLIDITEKMVKSLKCNVQSCSRCYPEQEIFYEIGSCAHFVCGSCADRVMDGGTVEGGGFKCPLDDCNAIFTGTSLRQSGHFYTGLLEKSVNLLETLKAIVDNNNKKNNNNNNKCCTVPVDKQSNNAISDEIGRDTTGFSRETQSRIGSKNEATCSDKLANKTLEIDLEKSAKIGKKSSRKRNFRWERRKRHRKINPQMNPTNVKIIVNGISTTRHDGTPLRSILRRSSPAIMVDNFSYEMEKEDEEEEEEISGGCAEKSVHFADVNQVIHFAVLSPQKNETANDFLKSNLSLTSEKVTRKRSARVAFGTLRANISNYGPAALDDSEDDSTEEQENNEYLLNGLNQCPGEELNDLERRDHLGQTAIFHACWARNEQSLLQLLQQGANANVRDMDQWSPLHDSVVTDFPAAVKILLQFGNALVDMPGGLEMQTPLHRAVAENRVHCARILLENGADFMARDLYGLTPLNFLNNVNSASELKKMLADYKSKQKPRSNLLQVNMDLEEEPWFPSGKDKKCPGIRIAFSRSIKTSTRAAYGKLLLNNKMNKYKKNVKIVKWVEQCTHLVYPTSSSNRVRRSTKILEAILAHKWIISEDWLAKSLQLNDGKKIIPGDARFLPDGLMVQGEASGDNGPKRSRIMHRKMLPQLFSGCQFHLFGNNDYRFPLPPRPDLSRLIELGGGKLLGDIPDFERWLLKPTVPFHADPNSKVSKCGLFVIVVPGDRIKPPRNLNSNINLVTPMWILDCIAGYKLIDTELDLVEYCSN